MDNQKLSEKIDYTKELFGESILPEIPEAISNNLKHNMWPLQEEAFRNFPGLYKISSTTPEHGVRLT